MPESPRELKGDFAPIKQHDTESPILKQCFFYSGKTEDIYYIPFISFYGSDFSVGTVSEWGCYIAVKKVTMKDGKIVENSFIDRKKMKLEVSIETGEGVFFSKSTCHMLPSEEGLWEFYRNSDSCTYKIQHEISCPLGKCKQDEECQYVILATANAGYQTPAKGVYEGKLNVSCSIGENTIETEWSFEYVVKEKT